METRTLQVEERAEAGTTSMRRLRREGVLPAVMYAEGKEAKAIKLISREYVLAVRGCRPSQIFKFQSKNSMLDGKMALIKSVQVEAIKGNILHVDFISIEEGHKVTVAVPLELYGESAAVKENRAFLNQTEYEIEIECLPSEIPASLKLNISELTEGGSLHASDVELPAAIKLKSNPILTVVSAISTKAMEAEQAAFEAAAAAAKAQGAAASASAATAAAAPAAGAAGAGAAAAAPAKGEKEKK